MGESICVNLSGLAFSLLLYENIKNESAQEGFLLGEVVKKEKRTITDNDQEVINVEHVIKINSVVPCPKIAYFYDSCGQVDKAKLKTLLGDELLKVVSWYKFTHTPSFKLTLREKIIHKELANYIVPNVPGHFPCCLLTTQSGSESGATHLFSQTFIRYYNPVFQRLPMHIENLSDPYDFYKSPEGCSQTFKNVLKSVKVDVNKTQGYAVVSEIEKALHSRISKGVADLSEAELEMYTLERQVKRLKNNLSIMHDCGDSVDVFGIFENGETGDEVAKPTTSSAAETKPTNREETVVNDTVRTRRAKSTPKNSPQITSRQDTPIPTRSYAQAMQKKKT